MLPEFFPHQASVEKKIAYRFKDPKLLLLAFVHRSYWNEHQDLVENHNERLEFLGDSVLGLIVANHLYRHFPELDEGILSSFRAQLVDAPACCGYIQKLDIEPYLLLGKGEQMNRGKGRESILADLFEAVIGAIYLDGGYEAATQFFFAHFEKNIGDTVASPAHNWKAELQDYAQKQFQQTPVYEVIEESGPAHQKHFKVVVKIGENSVGIGEGSSKKIAQAAAAKEAMEKIHG